MSILNRDVLVLCWESPTRQDQHAQRIASFLGADAKLHSLSPLTLANAPSLSALVPKSKCLIASADTLAHLLSSTLVRPDWARQVTELAENLFVHGFRSDGTQDELVRSLSRGTLTALQTVRDSSIRFAVSDDRRWCGQFAGVSFECAATPTDQVFVGSAKEPEFASLVRLDEKSFFVRLDTNGASQFFCAGAALADLDDQVGEASSPLDWFSRLIPLMMFLRGALGESVWHADEPRACIILDDPLLKKRYGFLEYSRLLESMDRKRFSASIAFIPWNYRRSAKEISRLFLAHSNNFSLCVHGCDHTAGEFATTNRAVLREKSNQALQRMQDHARRSGVPHDEVMVFPQGLFSHEALLELRAAGFLAAVNTDICPSTQRGTLIVEDLLKVAITRTADFPLFGRRYPRDVAEFAFDLFLGKPALIVEHHGYFRNGYQGIENFVAQLTAVEPRLEWSNLGTICSQACLTKSQQDGSVAVQFYTRHFQLTNLQSHTVEYVLHPQFSEDLACSVSIDGRKLENLEPQSGSGIRVKLLPGEVVMFRTCRPVPAAVLVQPEITVHNARVLVRRILSEVRDNHLETNAFFRRLLTDAKRFRARRKLSQAAHLHKPPSHPMAV